MHPLLLDLMILNNFYPVYNIPSREGLGMKHNNAKPLCSYLGDVYLQTSPQPLLLKRKRWLLSWSCNTILMLLIPQTFYELEEKWDYMNSYCTKCFSRIKAVRKEISRNSYHMEVNPMSSEEIEFTWLCVIWLDTVKEHMGSQIHILFFILLYDLTPTSRRESTYYKNF